ncbi:MAG TPA: hypothetical protein VIJ59_00220 [Caulobacteraceae bacterium]
MAMRLDVVGLNRLVARLEAMPPTVQAKLRVFMSTFTIRLKEQVQANIAANFHSTGPLYNSVGSHVDESPGEIDGTVATSGVPYAAIQEYGGKTPPHVIEAVRARALAFMPQGTFPDEGMGGGLVFAKRVNHPGSLIPERSYARTALASMRGNFEGGIREAVDEAVNTAMGADL